MQHQQWTSTNGETHVYDKAAVIAVVVASLAVVAAVAVINLEVAVLSNDAERRELPDERKHRGPGVEHDAHCKYCARAAEYASKADGPLIAE